MGGVVVATVGSGGSVVGGVVIVGVAAGAVAVGPVGPVGVPSAVSSPSAPRRLRNSATAANVTAAAISPRHNAPATTLRPRGASSHASLIGGAD